jgi:hypothetical protein
MNTALVERLLAAVMSRASAVILAAALRLLCAYINRVRRRDPKRAARMLCALLQDRGSR